MQKVFELNIFLMFILVASPLVAQSYLGIRNSEQQALPHFAIQFNGNQTLRSNAEGIIFLEKAISKVYFKKSKIEILHEEYLLHSKDLTADTLWVEVVRCQLLKGHVKTKNNFPLAGIRILLIHQESTQPTVSDEFGNFLLRVPNNKPLSRNDLIAFDISLTRLDLDYDIQLYPNDSLELIIEKSPQIVESVWLLNEDAQAMPNTTIFIDGKAYLSDADGKVKITHPVSELSAFYGQAMQVLKLEYTPQDAGMKVYLYTPDNPQLQFKTVHLGNRWVKNKD